MRVIKFPLRFDLSTGSIETVEQGTDQQKAQEVAAFVLTHKGERPLFSDFGMDDPAFYAFDAQSLSAGFVTYYPDVRIGNVEEVERRDSGVVELKVEFE